MTVPKLIDAWRDRQPQAEHAACWLVVALAVAVPLGSATANILTVLLLLTWLAAGAFRLRWQHIRAHPFALASIGLWLLILIGASWSEAPWSESWRNIEKYARVLLVPIVISLITDPVWRRRALLAWLGAMLITLALSYLHVFWAFPWARATRELAQGDHYIFKHHITQNVMMSVALVACVAEALRHWHDRTHPWRAWLWLALAIAAGFNVLFLVQGRTGYLTLFANLIVVALVLVRLRRVALLAPVLIVALAVGALTSDTLRQRTDAALREAVAVREGADLSSIGMRAEFLARSAELIRERPVFGWGTGSYASQWCRVAISPDWCRVGAYNPHNQFVFFGVQLGALGMLALLVWMGSAFWACLRQRTSERLLGLTLITTFLIHAMLDSPLYVATESVWYPLHLALVTAWVAEPQGSANRAETSSDTRARLGHSGQD